MIYSLQLTNKLPLRDIDGIAQAIWTYTLSWDGSTSFLSIDPGPRLAIVLSSRIGIVDPKHVPDVPIVQDTFLDKTGSSDTQRLYRDVQHRVGDEITFSFVAPVALEPSTVIRLQHQATLTGAWTNLNFMSDTASTPALLQVMPGPAIVCGPGAQPGPSRSPVLEHSTRSILRAAIGTFLVPSELFAQSSGVGDALIKYRFARQLFLQSGEVNAVRAHAASRPVATTDRTTPLLGDVYSRLQAFEVDSQFPTVPPSLSTLADVSIDALRAFGDGLVELRRQVAMTPASTQSAAMVESAEGLLRASMVASKGLALNTTGRGIQPIGYLNLERLEMAPAGIVRGELIATIPLAPLEETAVVQKEWSVTSKEFTSIVTDSLENFSETGVTDNTELAQSTTSQNQHSNQFNITGTVSGGIEQIFDASSTTGFTAQDSSSNSATASAKHSASITQKASSRVKKEHKVTISTTTVTGTSESTTRSLKNSDPNNPIRIDYFRMMREWRVRLYRYGVRLTYDLVIPEPAGALRQAHAYLGWLRSQLGPFQFNVAHFPPGYVKSKTDANYAAILKLADTFGAQIPPFPESPGPVSVVKQLTQGSGAGNVNDDVSPPIVVKDGYWIENLFISIRLVNVNAAIRVLFSTLPEQVNVNPAGSNIGPIDLTTFGLLHHATDSVVVWVSSHDVMNSFFSLEAVFAPTDMTLSNWLNDVWTALYNGAQALYYAQQQDIAAKISALEDRLNNVDTLTLRREESEEVMKVAVASLVGNSAALFWGTQQLYAWFANLLESQNGWPPIVDPTTPFAPGLNIDPRPIGAAFTRVADPEVYPWFPPIQLNETVVRFINQAIEWENVVTFLYSYCWDIPQSWDFIRNLQHADPSRQAFLRAGSARVVLTIREGWETMWNAFVQTGLPYYTDDTDPSGRPIPYMSIAQEIAAYDDHNYPGIPPANPSQSAVRLEEAVYTTTNVRLDLPAPTPTNPNPVLTNVEIEVVSNVGFLMGAQVVIDSGVGEGFPPAAPGRQESTTITTISTRDTKHITLAQIQNPHGQDGQPYAVLQPGEKGALIAEWNEYTPTSGTDIAVTSNLETIA